MFRRIGIVAKRHDPAVQDTLQTVVQVLAALDRRTIIDETVDVRGIAGHFDRVAHHELPDVCDLVISIGGDGTLLRSAGLIYPREVPLLGINLGRLGFLTDLPPIGLEGALQEVLDGHCLSELRAVLGCDVVRDETTIATADALNDVVVQKWNTARLITLHTHVDGKFLHAQRADGMIVATPTGSTAYALSGGGPILDPAINALALVPICPHTLTNRPIVVIDSALIEILVATARDDECRVTCDGNSLLELIPGDRVRIFRRAQSIRLIHPANHDHFATLRAKLNWGRDPC